MQDHDKDKKAEKQRQKDDSKEYEKPCLVKYSRIKTVMAASSVATVAP